MRAKRAKLIRKQAYGDKDFRQRTYYVNNRTGSVVADSLRRVYQTAKRAWRFRNK